MTGQTHARRSALLLQSAFWLRRIENPIGEQLHAVTHEEPCQRVSPHEAIVRLVGMVLVEQHDESAVALRHMSAGSLAKVATSAATVSSRTLRPRYRAHGELNQKPSDGAGVSYASLTDVAVQCAAWSDRYVQPLASGGLSRSRTWRAISKSSRAATTSVRTRASRLPISRSPASSLRAGSTVRPRNARPSAVRCLMAAAFSPTPPVNTRASRPPMAAAIAATPALSRCR